MAKIIKKPSALKNDYLKIKKAVNKTVFSAFIFIIMSIFGSAVMQNDYLFSFGIVLTSLSVLGFIICIITVISKQNSLAIKKQGVLGEDLTADMLSSQLNDDYTIFQNCIITLDGKSSETDLIVVGKSGIFIIETKNRNGIVEGNYQREKWTQHKTGFKGGNYSVDFYSPVKQVSTHIFRLAGFLRQNGIRVHIDGAVFFSNENAKLEISGSMSNIPVFCRKKDLIRFIKKNDNTIPTEINQKICELLK